MGRAIRCGESNHRDSTPGGGCRHLTSSIAVPWVAPRRRWTTVEETHQAMHPLRLVRVRIRSVLSEPLPNNPDLRCRGIDRRPSGRSEDGPRPRTPGAAPVVRRRPSSRPPGHGRSPCDAAVAFPPPPLEIVRSSECDSSEDRTKPSDPLSRIPPENRRKRTISEGTEADGKESNGAKVLLLRLHGPVVVLPPRVGEQAESGSPRSRRRHPRVRARLGITGSA